METLHTLAPVLPKVTVQLLTSKEDLEKVANLIRVLPLSFSAFEDILLDSIKISYDEMYDQYVLTFEYADKLDDVFIITDLFCLVSSENGTYHLCHQAVPHAATNLPQELFRPIWAKK